MTSFQKVFMKTWSMTLTKCVFSPMTSSTGKSRDFEDMVYDFETCVVFDNDVMFGKSVIFPLAGLMNLTPPLLALIPPVEHSLRNITSDLTI